MSFLKNLILNLPAVKNEIGRIEKIHRSQLEQHRAEGAREITDVRSSLQEENFKIKKSAELLEKEMRDKLNDEKLIAEKYNQIKNKNVIIDTCVVHVKKSRSKYNLILVKTRHGDFKINVGRHGESGVGLGEHSPVN